MPQTFRYPNLVTLDNVELTDESRQPLSEERDERSVIVDLASGKKKKFVKSVKRRWSIEWQNVAANANETVDGKGGYDEIKSIAEGAGFITLEISDGKNPMESFTVMVEDWSATLLRRVGDEGFRYTVTLGLTEQ